MPALNGRRWLRYVKRHHLDVECLCIRVPADEPVDARYCPLHGTGRYWEAERAALVREHAQ